MTTSMATLNIASNLSLPLEAVTETFAILAVRGVGKTHTASVMAEEMMKAGQPVCIYDPTGAWFGLKTSKDGKHPGFPVVIFGGEHADVPLEETAGTLIARVLVERRISAILDVSLLRKGARVRFMTTFLEELYHRNREPLHLFLDEAHSIAPQNLRAFPEAAPLVGALEDIVLQGRRRGLGVTAISQRPALLNTNIRTQCGTVIVMRIIGPHDRKAILEWVEAHASEEKARTMLDSLATLKKGEGWVWSPAWLDIFQRVKFRDRETFDSSATPKVGQRTVMPKVFAEIDLQALGEEIAATVAKVKADDPKALRAEIAELKRQLAAKPEPAPAIVETIDREALKKAQQAELARIFAISRERIKEAFAGLLQTAFQRNTEIRADLDALRTLLDKDAWIADGLSVDGYTALEASIVKSTRPVKPPVIKSPAVAPRVKLPPTAGVPMGRAERSILTVLAQRGPSTKSTVAAYAGYAVNGGGFNNAVSKCRTMEWLTGNGSDQLELAPAGAQALGSWEPLPTGPALLAHWQAKVGKAERVILSVLADHPRAPIAKDALAIEAQYASTGGGFNNALSRLRTLELIEGSGTIQLNKEFAEALRQ
jgi:uncharacterized protein